MPDEAITSMPAATQPPRAERPVTLTIIGDVTFGGALAADPAGLASSVEPAVIELIRADSCVANLEGVLADAPPGPIGEGIRFPMLGPVRAIDALRHLGIDVVTLANNHMMDYGATGLDSTLKTLDAAGLAHFGAGRNVTEASRLLVVERGGLRIGFIGLGSYPATRTRAGSMSLDWAPSRRLVESARRQCDFVVVYFHGGIEATSYPMKVQVQACRRLVECGADLVVGTHPHTIQGMEVYRGVPILYSIGDFLGPVHLPAMREVWRRQTTLAKLGLEVDPAIIERALVLKVTLQRGRPVEVRPVPIRVGDDGLPHALAGAAREEAEAFFAGLCGAFDRPDDPAWQHRDEIERKTRGLVLRAFSLGFILRNLHKIRLRHFIDLVKLLLAR
jgi:poly-gamma-glutamate capsule biosynthesis protein CapA/YwtB (metallophosphatase superfamily)